MSDGTVAVEHLEVLVLQVHFIVLFFFYLSVQSIKFKKIILKKLYDLNNDICY